MDTLTAEQFAADLEVAIDRQQGDYPGEGEFPIVLALIYIAKAIMHAADKIDDCARCLSHMTPP